MNDPRLLVLELNEVNLELVAAYAEDGSLPGFRKLLDQHGFCRTSSEVEYENLEPWIQWVTAHTGLALKDHGIFRLGDVAGADFEQIWERLEREHGLRTGALSPMNARNRAQNPAFFVPDPWTNAEVVAPPNVHALFDAIRQAVQDNSSGRITADSARALLRGLLRFARPANYPTYAKLFAGALRGPWNKALILDLLLSDLFLAELDRTRPDFATLFLNAAAHIQHHYFFNSKHYSGEQRNPAWYVSASADPVYDAYRLYDAIVGRIQKTYPNTRIMLATGLHQVPHETTTFYWRLRDHDAFLRDAGIPFERVEPRMSRDFLVTCRDESEARRAEAKLSSARAHDGAPLFAVDNRGDTLFVTLSYPSEIGEGFGWTINGTPRFGLKRDVSFVAIKNGQHDGTGYFVDTGLSRTELPVDFPLAHLSRRITEAATA